MRTILLTALLLPAACDRGEPGVPATRDLGTGLNTVDREHARPPGDLVDAALRALPALELKVESEKRDALGGEIVARRATGDKVSVAVKGAAPGSCRVSVRVDPGDRNLANLVHDRIARELNGAAEPKRP